MQRNKSMKTNSVQNRRVRAMPIARAVRFQPSAPKAVRSTNGVTTYSGSDLLVESLAGSVSWSASKHYINPALPSFAGLSAVAQRFDMYRFKKLEFHYVPEQAVTTTAGTIHMACDPNPNQTSATSKADMSVYAIKDYSQVYDPSLVLRVPKKFLGPDRLTRCGPVSGDLRQYDPISFILATTGEADTSAIGDIYVSYEVDFYGTQVEPLPVPRALAQWNLDSDQAFTSGVEATVEVHEEIANPIQTSNTDGVLTPGCGAFEVAFEGTFADSATETFVVQLEIKKNGSALSPPVKAQQVRSALMGSNIIASISGIVILDDDDTVEVVAELTGASGTLTAQADHCRLKLRVLN